jgi:hypothetical protein
MTLLCSSRWSGQKCCKIECVALKRSFQTRPITNVSSLNPISCKIQIYKVRVEDLYFYETYKIFNNFSRENPGHEHGVRRGVFWGKLLSKKMSRGSSLYFARKPSFWVPTIKVRPPDGKLLCVVTFVWIYVWDNCISFFFSLIIACLFYVGGYTGCNMFSPT